jgi:hypothetical protein
MKRKGLSVGIILLFVGTCIIPAIAQDIQKPSVPTSRENWLYVGGSEPGNYSRITDAVNDASDGTHFYGESNASIYIITVESQSEITLVDGYIILTLRSNGTHTITCTDFGGGWVVNETVIAPFPKCGSESVFVGALRYFHMKFGNIINYTYDNRSHQYQEYQHNELLYGYEHNFDKNYTYFTLPAGKWHFIFTAMMFDLEQDDVLPNYKVWLNFSEDLKITTSEGGKIYALYYPEYDAGLVLSKAWKFECMLNGKASFDIENTFIYEFLLHPRVNGFWSIKWNTPDGMKNFNMIMRKRNLYYNEDKVKDCVWGIGKSGHYDFISSSIDYDPEMLRGQIPLFFGFDVQLP